MTKKILFDKFAITGIAYSPVPENYCVILAHVGEQCTIGKEITRLYCAFPTLLEIMEIAGEPGKQIIGLITDFLIKNGDAVTGDISVYNEAFGAVYFNNLIVEADINDECFLTQVFDADGKTVYTIRNFQMKVDYSGQADYLDMQIFFLYEYLCSKYSYYETLIVDGIEENNAKRKSKLDNKLVFQATKMLVEQGRLR